MIRNWSDVCLALARRRENVGTQKHDCSMSMYLRILTDGIYDSNRKFDATFNADTYDPAGSIHVL